MSIWPTRACQRIRAEVARIATDHQATRRSKSRRAMPKSRKRVTMPARSEGSRAATGPTSPVASEAPAIIQKRSGGFSE